MMMQPAGFPGQQSNPMMGNMARAAVLRNQPGMPPGMAGGMLPPQGMGGAMGGGFGSPAPSPAPGMGGAMGGMWQPPGSRCPPKTCACR